MGGGLAFLTKKSFNPANWSNQRQVWEARQKHATEERAIAERHSQLGRERDEEELARAVGGEVDGGRKALGFMYEAGKVPGLERKGQDNEVCYRTSIFGGEADEDGRQRGGGRGGEGGGGGGGGSAKAEASVFERQAGDDDAAAAFRAMLSRPPPEVSAIPHAAGLAAAVAPPNDDDEEGDDDADGAAEDDKNDARDRDQRTNLEKAVGRGINAGSGVTLTQQFERFPMLKSAPMVLQKPTAGGGGGAEAQSLNFKPLGQVLRNVQCLKCREWGHARGDRECKLSGWDPFAVASVAPVPAPVAANVTSDPAPVVNAQPGSNAAPALPVPDHRKHKKRERRRKDDGRKKKKHRHKRRRRHERSPSYSSSSSASSLSTQGNGDSGRSRHAHSRGRHRRHRQYADADDSSRQESSRGRHKSSRRHGAR